ncbi:MULTISPECIES: hypothetical protein [Burkholderiaceae]|nr:MULTISPECIES: hypothetical protein [Burkholderiaceae]
MKTYSRAWWLDLQNHAVTTKDRLVCAMMLCALAYTGSVPVVE